MKRTILVSFVTFVSSALSITACKREAPAEGAQPAAPPAVIVVDAGATAARPAVAMPSAPAVPSAPDAAAAANPPVAPAAPAAAGVDAGASSARP